MINPNNLWGRLNEQALTKGAAPSFIIYQTGSSHSLISIHGNPNRGQDVEIASLGTYKGQGN